MKFVKCPFCGETVDGVSDTRTVDLFTRCRKCHTGLRYDIKTGTVTESNAISRSTSSGMTFTRRDYGE